ncbi:MAG TPA: DUF445 domain-containing protein [Pseudonocardiaceae bacterium]|jgi:uncharacterized membrane protein YheB (UPF0754 family)|nr:DUF445 domain-containing protein [Pseudonocardiaceae bacterium]
MDFSAVFADVAAHWPIYLSMPFVAAAIGYVTKRVAIEMMFRPLAFAGVRRTPIGWQGVLPRNAARMATTAVQLLTSNLISVPEIFARLDPAELAKAIEGPLLHVVDELTPEIVEQYQPGLWERLPGPARELLLRQVRVEAPRLVTRIMTAIGADIDSVLDVSDMAVTHLVRDKALLNRLIRDIAKNELAFIASCGLYFGFLLGVVQMVLWAFTHSPLVMPLFGLGVGWLTDWLALKMIFLPREPRRFFGLVSWQGVFQKRRQEVAADYGTLIAAEILTADNIMDTILHGPRSDRLFALIQREVEHTIDERMSLAKPLVTFAVGSGRFDQLKLAAATRTIERLPETLSYARDYTTEALDVRNTIVDKMRGLTPIQFEGLLRPAFQQDEWKLIAVGAAIGFLVGELQVFVFLH